MSTDKSSEREALKPCPFCGGDAHRTKTGGDDERSGYNFTIRLACTNCGASIEAQSRRDNGWCNDTGEADSVASAKWNARAALPQQAQEAPRYMPIMGTPLAMPFDLLDERQAQINHSQSLARLAERGGLGPSEALAVVKRERWDRYQHMKRPEVLAALVAAIAKGEHHE